MDKELRDSIMTLSDATKQEALVELLRKCVANAEQMVSTFEDTYAIRNDLRRTIEQANDLLQKLDQDKAIQELPEWNIKKDEPSLDELLSTLPMRHFSDVTTCFEACKSKSDIAKVIKTVPAYFGTLWAEYDDTSFIIVNRFFDDELGRDWEEEYWYDYPKDWQED